MYSKPVTSNVNFLNSWSIYMLPVQLWCLVLVECRDRYDSIGDFLLWRRWMGLLEGSNVWCLTITDHQSWGCLCLCFMFVLCLCVDHSKPCHYSGKFEFSRGEDLKRKTRTRSGRLWVETAAQTYTQPLNLPDWIYTIAALWEIIPYLSNTQPLKCPSISYSRSYYCTVSFTTYHYTTPKFKQCCLYI